MKWPQLKLLSYDPEDRILKTWNNRLLKQLACPANKDWESMEPVGAGDIKRHCQECKKTVLNINRYSAEEIQTIIQYDPDVCVYFSNQARSIRLETPKHKNKRVIYTARDVDTMNEAVKQGCRPLIKDVVNTLKIHEKLAVWQDPETGRVEVSGDLRFGNFHTGKRYEYNPNHWDLPFAAYIVPKDLEKGEEVILDDLIEEYVGSKWNQGDTFRLHRGPAIWNGSDFDIQYTEPEGATFIG